MKKSITIASMPKSSIGKTIVIVICLGIVSLSCIAVFISLNQAAITNILFPSPTATTTPTPKEGSIIYTTLLPTPTPTEADSPETIAPADNAFQNKLRALGVQNHRLVTFSSTEGTLIGAFLMDATTGQIILSKSFQSGSQRENSSVIIDPTNGDIYYTAVANAPKMVASDFESYDPCYDQRCDYYIWKTNILNTSKVQVAKMDYPFYMYFDKSVPAIYTQRLYSSTVALDKIFIPSNISSPYLYLPYGKYSYPQGVYISDGKVYVVPKINSTYFLYTLNDAEDGYGSSTLSDSYAHFDKIFKLGETIYLIGHDGYTNMYLYSPNRTTSTHLNISADSSTNIVANSQVLYLLDSSGYINRCYISNDGTCEKTSLKSMPVSTSYDNLFLIVGDPIESGNLTLMDLAQDKPVNIKNLIDALYPGKNLGDVDFGYAWFNQDIFTWFTIGRISD